jgi:hypothetical protein
VDRVILQGKERLAGRRAAEQRRNLGTWLIFGISRRVSTAITLSARSAAVVLIDVTWPLATVAPTISA